MDVIFSGVLILFSIYLYVLVGIESPGATPTELGAAFWPRIILVLLILLLVVNLVQSLKSAKAEHKKLTAGFDLGGFFKSKLMVGILIVAIMALIMPHVGFIPSSFLFLCAYGFLLGEKRPVRLLLLSSVLTIVIYMIFQGALDIMLARGNGIFRDFALMMESLLPF